MTRTSLCAGTVLLAALSGAASAAPHNQGSPQAAAQPARPTLPATPTPPSRVDVLLPSDERAANQTRDELRHILDQYPPTVHDVLRLDPSLLSRPDYLATYPTLNAFLQRHPEVAHNPTYFVGNASGVRFGQENSDPKVEAVRAWRNFAEFIPVVAIIFIITSALAGLIRMLIDQRLWQRAARMQIDLQNKLIDRFSNSSELLAYMQSPVGRGLAELHTPTPSSGGITRAMDAPLGRIFWSLQAGIVLAAAGIGLLFVAARATLDELSQPVFGMGVLALTIGIGFVVSAGASYLISRRLGLVAPARTPDFPREAPGA